MPGHRLIVLKFGGSVLRDEATLRLAVHEIYRWRRRGWRVAAVVSALAGRTDELLRLASRATGRLPSEAADPCPNDAILEPHHPGTGLPHRNAGDTWQGEAVDPHAVAALIATGELHSAGLLGVHLDRAGVRAAVLWPMSFDLTAEGPPLDADPVSPDRAPLERALARHGVVIVPGYAAHDADGRPVVLGRGGSDLTALFLAHELSAEKCRLIKDVDGLYDRDPAEPGGRRYATATFADALATDGSIIQHKALGFAEAHGLPFELGRINGRRASLIGAARTRFAASGRPRRLRVALLGFGTVGGGVFELLRQMPEQFEVTAIAVRDPSRRRVPRGATPAEGDKLSDCFTTDAVAAATSGADIVVEAIGGTGAARQAVGAALGAGAEVVSANKSLIAAHGQELGRLAALEGVSLHYSAAVGGSMPLLECCAAAADSIRSVRGVINGTTNFILDRVSGGLSFAEALRLAQEHGYAEQDPAQDLSGLDAAEKLCVIARHIGAGPLSRDDIACDVLNESSVAAALVARRPNGGPLRHVASLIFDGGRPRGEVRLLQVGPADPLARALDAGNVAVIEHADGRREIFEGKGAGRWPTAEAVLADVLEIARELGEAGECRKAEFEGSFPSAEAARPHEEGRERAYTAVLRV